MANEDGATPRAGTSPAGGEERAALEARVAQLEEQLRAVGAIGSAMATSVGLDMLFQQLVPNISRLIGDQRTTLFLYNEPADEIWSKVVQGESAHQIRLRMGEGIAGWVAKHLEPIIINDAYSDPRFNPEVDRRTGFRTETMATVPLVDRNRKLLGVLQVLNHGAGLFRPNDLQLLSAIAVETAYAVENAALAQELLDQNEALATARARAEARSAELDLLCRLEQEISGSINLNELLDSVVHSACERLRSDGGSASLLDRETGGLFVRSVRGEHETPHSAGWQARQEIVDWVAKHREPVVVNTPGDDPRQKDVARAELGHPTQPLLAVPLIWDEAVVGALEVSRPAPRPGRGRGYDEDDVKVLTLIGGQLAGAISRARERQARMDMERLAAMGRMLAGVAHDLRNPMTVISGFAQLMASETEENERQGCCNRILGQIDQMTNMVSDLLAFARGDRALKPASVKVEELVAELRVSLAPRCKKHGVRLSVTGTGDSALVDANRAKRIVYNLANNAVDAMADGGQLTVGVREARGGLQIAVSDDGPGLPDAVRARMFQPFVTAGKVNGTGLGLAIVKRFVDDHGGTIHVETVPGEGTTFEVTLPRAGTGSEARGECR